MLNSILRINATLKSVVREKINDADVIGPVDFALKEHLKSKSYENDVFHSSNKLIFGSGPLSHAELDAVQQLIFTSRSPTRKSLFSSSIDGGANILEALGVDFVVLEGKSQRKLIMKVIGDDSTDIRFEYDEISDEKLQDIFNSYRNKSGFFALEQYVYDMYAEDFIKSNSQFRVFAIGPGSLKTDFGGVGSTLIKGGQFKDGFTEWTNSGGLGSVMARAHNVVALAIGGNFKRSFSLDKDEIKEVFKRELVRETQQIIKETTEKYNYSKGLMTGGTFGVHYSTLGSWFLAFNWNTVYLNEGRRQEYFNRFIKNHYLAQYNTQIFGANASYDCGAPCITTCKKMQNSSIKNFEPYALLGPNCGVFDLENVEEIMKMVGTSGLDADETGTMVGWLMDCLNKGLFKKADFNITSDRAMKFSFDEFVDMKYSYNNFLVVQEIINEIMHGTGLGKYLRNGVGHAAEELNIKFVGRAENLGISFSDLAVYVSNSKSGGYAPLPFWNPAFLFSLPIEADDYVHDFKEPTEMGRFITKRGIKNLSLLNSGVCSLHKKWADVMIERILNKAYKTNIDLFEHHRRLLKKINEYNGLAGAEPAFWESRKVYDILSQYMEKLYYNDINNIYLMRWFSRFKENKEKAAKLYWDNVNEGIQEVLL